MQPQEAPERRCAASFCWIKGFFVFSSRRELRRILPDLREVDGFFFDLDGTIMLGDRLLPAAGETFSVLRETGKSILFLSNTTTRTRRECQARLQAFGLEAHVHEVVTAAYAAAVYFTELRDPVVYPVGEPALIRELDELGVRRTEDPLRATHVLVGMDMHFDYGRLHQAMKAVRGGAALIAANPDPYCPVDGDVIPDTWAMVKAIEAASCAETQVVIGKPSDYYARKALQWSGLPAKRCLMVGDRLDTDILLGLGSGMRTALVLTGVTARSDLDASPIRPDYVWDSLGDLLEALRSDF